jgi:hypothetical protein
MMTPQLFINYKLKSVAHMPWKTFMYKALNTFIDDLFAFIIRMPVLHRLACFRDGKDHSFTNVYYLSRNNRLSFLYSRHYLFDLYVSTMDLSDRQEKSQ